MVNTLICLLARLNPIPVAVAEKIARTGGILTYRSHTSQIVHSEAHSFHRFQGVSYRCLPAEIRPIERLNPNRRC
jgi:hypothetical protein